MTTAEEERGDSPRRTRRIDDGDGGREDTVSEADMAGGESSDTAMPESNRRPRLDQRFPPGAIMRVTLKNFVTYTAAEFFPGPNMNLVIGPNGSGKSTIVCAISLGLGYKPEVLGRAAQTSEFVQFGKDAAEIEIELAQPDGGSVVVKRRIKRDKNQSHYWIDGRQSTHAKVQELMAEFNIQCDNLCQFLPQDKVASFAAITPTELLRETQRAVGGEEMVNCWKHLINLRAEERDLQHKFDNDKTRSQQLNKKQEADKIHVDRYRHQEHLSSQIDQLKLRIPFARYRSARAIQSEKKEERNVAKASVQKLQERDAPMVQRVEAYKARKAECERQKESRGKSFDRVLKAVTEQEKEVEKFSERAIELRNDLARIRKTRQTRLKDIAEKKKNVDKARHGLAKWEEEVAKLPPNWRNDVNAESAEATEKRTQARNAFRHAQDSVQNLQSDYATLKERYEEKKEELNNLSSTFKQRLNALISSKGYQEHDTARVVQWLESGGKSRFKGTVYLPPALTVSVIDPRYAHLAESCFQLGDLLTFTCSSREDYILFGRLVLDNEEKNFETPQMVRVVENSGGKRLVDWQSPVSKQELTEFGLEFYLRDILTGPDQVLNTLCYTNSIHAVPLSFREIDSRMHDRLSTIMNPHNPEKLLFEKYVTGSTRFVLTRERYGAQNTAVVSIDSQKTDEIQHQMRLLKDDMNDVHGKLLAEQDRLGIAADEKTKAEELANVVQQKKKHYNNTLQERDKASGSVQTAESALRAAQRKPDNSEEHIAQVTESQKSNARQCAEISIKLAELVKQGSGLIDEVVVAHIKAVQASADEVVIKAEAGNSSQELAAAKAKLGKIDHEYLQAKAECKRILEEAQNLLLEQSRSEDEFREIANNDTATVEELEEELENAQKILESHQRHNVHGLIEAYEKRAKEIEEIAARMDERQEEIGKRSDEITKYRMIWEPRLQRLVARISDVFGEAFRSIGCAGEVLLKRGNDQDPTDDFETWSVDVMVKFRETEKLQPLTAQTQSGGERSVSTIFYLLALQELAKAPFRVVDEINQGMDPRNERLVHSRLVDAACRPGTSQYFLITPKLLPGLKYHRNMKVLTINNGKFVPDALDIASVIEHASQLPQD